MNCSAGQLAMIVQRPNVTPERAKALTVFVGCVVRLTHLEANDVWMFETPIRARFLLEDDRIECVDLVGIEDEYLLPLEAATSPLEIFRKAGE